MKKKYLFLVFTMIGIASFTIFILNNSNQEAQSDYKPIDWFYQQRAYPSGEMNREAYRDALQQAKELRVNPVKSNGVWTFAGPNNIGGRLTDIEINPLNEEEMYLGTASGGIFKTNNGGLSFSPIFDEQLSLSIGDIALAPNDSEIVYVGTGEANPGGGSLAYDGNGLYRSNNGGESWSHLGLDEIGSVGRVVVSNENPDIAYVAAMGYLFENNPERGVFKTTDGGENWTQILYVNDSTGAIDLAIHPENPDTIYAVMWERVRRLEYFKYGGYGSDIYRSYDGGENWEELDNGLPTGLLVGRIGIGISPSNPSVLYAIYADRTGYFDGLFKSEDGGDTWIQTNDAALSDIYASYGWWFGRLKIDPQDENTVYGIGFDLFKTSDGGNSWQDITGIAHVDQHEIAVSPTNSNRVYLASDGGFYESLNAGSTWSHNKTLPITQFYTAAIDASTPYRVYGGTQDNGTNRTLSGSPDTWTQIYGGDGFYCIIDPTNAQYVYAEYQYGNLARSTNYGSNFSSATTGISSNDRKNWNTPVVMNPNNPSSLYYGSHRLYKSLNKAVNWEAISEDLTNGPGGGNQKYGTITSISVSKVDTNIIYVGTDDANVWMSQDNGGNWNKVSDNLPNRWISRVVTDPVQPSVAYVCLSGFRENEYMPHVFMTEDYGSTWLDISEGLPEAPVNDLVVWNDVMKRLIIATDVGVFYKDVEFDGWHLFAEGLPLVPITDLALDVASGTLAAATFGRSMYTYTITVGAEDIPSNLSEITVFPNPASHQINVNIPSQLEKIDISIHDIQGREVYHQLHHSVDATVLIDVHHLQKGLYMMTLKNGAYKKVEKLLIQ